MNDNSFKPFVPAEKNLPEFTATSIILGILLAVLFGGANAYLGLRVGMTVSASIPAAVISMGVIRVILRRDSVLENNMVQTIGSAGESLRRRRDLYNACVFPVGKGGHKRPAGDAFHLAHSTAWRAARRPFYGSAQKSAHRQGTWRTAVS